MDDYKALIKSLRWLANMFPEMHPAEDDADRIFNNIHLYCKAAADAIEKLQANVRPVVRGEWIHHKGGYSDHYECTVCKKAIVLTERWNFCPNCGADMREVYDG